MNREVQSRWKILVTRIANLNGEEGEVTCLTWMKSNNRREGRAAGGGEERGGR